MTERTVRCGECGRRNRLPDGFLVEARCGRCEWPLTAFTWGLALFRRRSVTMTLRAAAAVAVLVVLFGGDVAEWWESEPFRLSAGGAEATVTAERLPSLADEAIQ